MYSSRMGPHSERSTSTSMSHTETEVATDLDALREAFPAWDIHRVFGGYEAVPAGTPVIRGVYLESMAEKLAALEHGRNRADEQCG